MATANNNLSVLPFYSSTREQDFRIWGAFGGTFRLFASKDYLIPFFFCLPKQRNRTIASVRLFNACTDEVMTWEDSEGEPIGDDIKSYMMENGLSIYTIGQYDVVYYPAKRLLELPLNEGYYYLQVVLSSGLARYSDAFYLKDETYLDTLTRITWTNESNVVYEGGVIPYESSERFINTLYLDAPIGMPEYNFTEEGEERNGYFFAIKQISEKTFRTRFFAPEYLCDAMRLIRMADYVNIYDGFSREYDCDTFLMSVDWLEQGHYASVECEFQTDTIVKTIGKAYSFNVGD